MIDLLLMAAFIAIALVLILIDLWPDVKKWWTK